jgi:hypothetical protein
MPSVDGEHAADSHPDLWMMKVANDQPHHGRSHH